MIQLYRPGTSPLHRMPASAKLVGLAAVASVMSTAVDEAWSMTIAGVGIVVLFLVARLPLRVLLGEIWRLRWLVLVLGGALWIFVSPAAAGISTTRVVLLVLSASLLTFTTRMSDLLAVLHRVLRPLRRSGVDADAVAMTVSLTLTMIPVVAGFAGQVADAHRARGARPGLRAVIPLLVRTLRHADDVGDALAARGLG